MDLPPLGDDADFVIPLARYREALAKKWRPDDPCAVVWRDFEHEETWYYGVVHAQNPDVDAQWRGSPWNALVVEYYNTPNPSEKFQMHSFRSSTTPRTLPRERGKRGGGKTAAVAAAAAATSRRPHPHRHHRHLPFPKRFASLCSRRRRRRRAIGDLRFSPRRSGATSRSRRWTARSANYCSIVPLPMALDTIARRLRAGYYRQPESFAHDVETIRRNCERFNGAASEYSKLAAALEETLASDVPPTNRDATALGVGPRPRSGTESTRTERGARDRGDEGADDEKRRGEREAGGPEERS